LQIALPNITTIRTWKNRGGNCTAMDQKLSVRIRGTSGEHSIAELTGPPARAIAVLIEGLSPTCCGKDQYVRLGPDPIIPRPALH
jgi:hypothetical protein